MAGMGTTLLMLGALIFVWSGTAKLQSPSSTAQLLTNHVGRLSSKSSILVLGAGEILIGTACDLSVLFNVQYLTIATSIVMTAAYLVFGGVLLNSIRRDVVEPCGCFGSTADRPLSLLEAVRPVLLGIGTGVGIAIAINTDALSQGTIMTIIGTVAFGLGLLIMALAVSHLNPMASRLAMRIGRS